MKKIYTLLAALLFTSTMYAQSPDKLSFQAVVRDASNATVTNQQVGVQISILQGSATGTVVYSETHTPTTNGLGLMTLEIGTGTVGIGPFSGIDWSSGPYFIKTETDPTGGTNYTISGTSELLAVPYSIHSRTADSLVGALPETDPVFGSHLASSITMMDTASWNNKLDNYTETDPLFMAAPASNITGADITSWDNKLSVEVDGSVTNEIQTLSFNNDTLFLTNGGFANLSGYASPWTSTASTVYNSSTMTIGVGTSSPITSYKFDIRPGEKSRGMYFNHDRTTSGTTYAIYYDLDNTYTGSATTYGGYFDTYKSGGGGSTYGLMGRGRNYNTSGSGSTYGVYAYGYRSSSTPSSTTYALYAWQSGSATTEWAGYFSGNVYTTGTYQPSDRALKTDVQNYEGALPTLLKLNTYTYSYNNDKYKFMNLPQGPQIGLIAQDVKALYPELSTTVVQPAQIMPVEDANDWVGEGNYTVDADGNAVVGEETTFTGVNYAGFVPVLIQAVKEQQALIDAQQAEIQKLQQLVNQLIDEKK